MRLDQALVDLHLTESREKAKRCILAGQVRVNGQQAKKPSDDVSPEDTITIDAPEKYVSRGGHKLEAALDEFKLDVNDAVAIDLGASTGGFTDCLLQRGVERVYAVDVGHGQLAWKLRRDSRVVVMEKMNARALTKDQFRKPFNGAHIIVIDCSFISLRKILPAAFSLLQPAGKIVALVKPQFEAGKAEADKGAGVITDPDVHARVLKELRDFVTHETTLKWRLQIESPLLGPAGNKEFLVLLEKDA